MCATYKQHPKRILVVDDDIDLLMLLERRLLKEGYAVETAASLAGAEEIIVYFVPHLVLIDINVNGHDGRQLCWKLKQQNPEVRVLLISGYDCNAGRASLFGADGLLPKPLHTEFLLHQVTLLLQGGKATPFLLSTPKNWDEGFQSS